MKRAKFKRSLAEHTQSAETSEVDNAFFALWACSADSLLIGCLSPEEQRAARW